MLLLLWTALAIAAPNPGGMDVSLAVEGQLMPGDVELYLRDDGQAYLGDEVLRLDELAAAVAGRVASDPELRLVIGRDRKVGRDVELKVVELARQAGVRHLGMQMAEADVGKAGTPIFAGPSTGPTIDLSSAIALPELTDAQLEEFRPKRSRLPQNPYDSSDFSAYTLEWGEARVGLLGIGVGVLPRVEVGTVPLLDAIGVWNGSAKVNAMRLGPLDGAVLGQFYYAPFNSVLQNLDAGMNTGLDGRAVGEALWTSTIQYAGVGGLLSLQVLRPWSLHGGIYVGRLQAEGMYDLEDLPSVILPGIDMDLTGGLDGQLSPRVGAQITSMSLATDVRFNRRDAVVVQFSSMLGARADASLELSETDIIDDVPDGSTRLQLVYAAPFPMGSTWAASLAYQLTWRHLEARFGIGAAAPISYTDPTTGAAKTAYNPLWALKSFDLAWHFGGETRREEGRVLRGYRRNVRDLDRGGDRVGG